MAGKHKAEDSATRPHRRNSADENQSSARQCSLKEEARDWDIQQVANFLEQENLEEFVPIFKAEKITGAVLCDITDDTLEKMGIKAAGDKLKILQTLKPFGHVRERNDWKVFNDPIHGHIELHPLCVKIVDTPQFQRLRYIKQLGGCYFVFPGASHNRFEHCIGVCYLAGQLVKTLKEKQPELDITEIDMLCVQIAGLCHDLGLVHQITDPVVMLDVNGTAHAIFINGNESEMCFVDSHGRGGSLVKYHPRKHEDASVDMFDYMVENCDLIPEFEKYGLTEKDRIFIKEQIAGPLKENKVQYGRDVKKKFLYEIVANKRNGIDVDKWDYFDRDCHMLGIKNNFDHVRFMKLARVCDVEGVTQICPRDKEVDNLYDMFHTRRALHRRAYQHKNSYIVETMIVEAMVKADDHIKIPGRDGKPMKISETIDDMAAFCKLTDHIFHLILLSTKSELKEARTILENIQRRKLYKYIGQTVPKSGVKLPEGTESEIRERISQAMTDEELGKPQLKPDDFDIHIINLDYGMKDKNPIDHVRFYEKSNPSLAKLIRKDEVSQMLPVVFAERHIRCYCKKLDEDSISIATRCFERWREQITMPKSGDPPAMDLTPPLQNDSMASQEMDTGTTPK